MNQSAIGYAIVNFGLAGDRPVAADYDGDRRADPAVYRGGMWYIKGSTNGSSAFQFGIETDLPVPADYDGDGKADAAVYRDGSWYILEQQVVRQSSNLDYRTIIQSLRLTETDWGRMREMYTVFITVPTVLRTVGLRVQSAPKDNPAR